MYSVPVKTEGWEGPRTGVDVVVKKKSLVLQGIESILIPTPAENLIVQ
jgi:hypothetical protein